MRDYMWDLIPLKEQSKIKMIEMFYATDDPITINTLSETTNTSIRSIKNYLEELKQTMSIIEGEFISSSEGVNFKIPINIGLDYFQKQLFRQSTGFKLLEKIFFDETLTNNQLIEELYISQSTLNRLIKTISEALEPYGLKLETSPYKVIGNEYLIRSFFTTYFVEAYTSNEWPFETLEKKIIDDILPSAVDYYQSTSELMNYTYFKFRFAVGLIRNLHGYSHKNILSGSDSLALYYENLFLEAEETISFLTFSTADEKNSYVNELVINQLLISKSVLKDRLKQDNELRKHIEEIELMINFLTNHFELPEEDQINLIVEIDNALSFFTKKTDNFQPRPFVLYPPRDYSLVDLYQKKYTTFYDTVQHNMFLLCKSRGFEPTDDTLNFLVYLLISKWKGLTKYLFRRYNTTVLKVYSHLSLRHAQNIAESLVSDLPDAIEVSVFKEASIDEEIVSKYDFDILITTETLNLEIEQPIVYMYKSRSSHQYKYLHKLIKETAKQKEKAAREKFIRKHQISPARKETIE